MSTKGQYLNGVATQFMSDTGEVVFAGAPIFYREEFLGLGNVVIPASAESGMDWIKKIVGAAPPTVAGVADASGGVVACALTADSQKQDAAIYHGDQRSFDVTKGLVFQANVKLSVLPSAAGAQMVCGVQSDWVDGPDAASFYIEFGAKANGAISCRIKDGVATQEVASGVTLTAGQAALLVIDASDVTNVKFYINGARVAAATTFAYAATGADAVLQPMAGMYKASGTAVGTLQVDNITLWQASR